MGFRHDLWREKASQGIRTLVDSLMLTLVYSSQHEVFTKRSQVCTLSTAEIAYPTPLKTVLRAEIALCSLLETRWALQRACIVFAF
jgi:hypothetical protein